MLIEAKRPKRPQPKVEEPVAMSTVTETGKKMSKMEQRLLGSSLIADQDKRKSVAARKKEEEIKLKKLMEEVAMTKRIQKSCSSEESDEEVIEGDYFMLRRKAEVKLIKDQFSFLMQNRAEYLEKNKDGYTLDLDGISPCMSQIKIMEDSN